MYLARATQSTGDVHMRQTALCTITMAFLCAFQAAPAQAQSRVFVAAQGLDTNPCTFAQPCRTFQHAHDVLASNGEIDVLDPAGYGTINITKAISIQGHGFSGISAPSGTAITINAAASDKISLRGLLLDGVGSGNAGIVFGAGASLDVQECLIRNFTIDGLDFIPSATSSLVVTNSIFASNAINGIVVAGAGSPSGVLDHVVVERNAADGLQFGAALFTVSDSVIANNGNHGVNVNTQQNPAAVMLRNVVVSNNNKIVPSSGVKAGGALSVIRITKSTITGNNLGFEAGGGGLIISGGDNFVAGNTTDGVPTSTIPLK
jgi:hypothetical protein